MKVGDKLYCKEDCEYLFDSDIRSFAKDQVCYLHY